MAPKPREVERATPATVLPWQPMNKLNIVVSGPDESMDVEMCCASSSTSNPGNIEEKIGIKSPRAAFSAFEALHGIEDFPCSDATSFLDYSNSNVALEMLNEMNIMRQDLKLCDVEIEVENQKLYAHRYLLAAVSPYFRAMFTNGMIETTKSKIVMRDVTKESLELLIDYIYTTKIRITGSNVMSLLFTASILQMDNIVGECQKYLTTKIRKSEEFYTLSFKDIESILKRSELHVQSEEQVFETLLDWVEYDCDTRKQYLPELLKTVRLALVSMRFLCDVMNEHPFVKESRECRDVVLQALFAILTPFRASTGSLASALSDSGTGQYAAGAEFSSISMYKALMACPDYVSSSDLVSTTFPAIQRIPRKSVAGVVFCAGGRGTAGDPFMTVEAYDWRKNTWFYIPDMTTKRRHVGLVSALGRLYAIGGHSGVTHLDSAEVYVQESSKWEAIASMQHPRRGIAVAPLETAIYAVGGLDDNSCFKTVERYDIELNTWSKVADMNLQRGGVGVAALGKYLYAVGGNDGTSSLDSCERFDPLLDRWKYVKAMNNRRAGAGVCVLDGCVYAIGGFDDNAPLATCERYDPAADVWTAIASMKSARGGVGVASMGGRVYAIGGHNGTRYLNTVESYDPATDTWSLVANIKECRAGAGVAWADCRVDQLTMCTVQDSGCAPTTGTPCV
ncbi:unnamed protein product [Caenorhabditis auriculariae]|uniref:BTB domain-containing protein n=1 Tax=Caenorhabditis auriculariae TaxID=2777116 RepID=A0A8S1H3I6_9PELO|nr:unnamed protein product [Caenorhabditis auriculariae]